MTSKRTALTPAQRARAVSNGAPKTPRRAMAGPYVVLERAYGAELTNAEALDVLEQQLGGPPVVGELYYVGLLQGPDGRRRKCIAEFLGLVEDRRCKGAGRVTACEPALVFVLRFPVLPAGGPWENLLAVWPLEIWYLGPAEPSDLKLLLASGFTALESSRVPGRERIQ